MTSIRLHYTEEIIRTAVARLWWRTLGLRFIVAFLLVGVSLAGLTAAGDRSRVSSALVAVLILATIFAAALYAVHYRSSMGRFRRMRVPEATLEIGEESFRVTSDVGSSEIAWGVVSEIWVFPEVLLVFIARAQFITIPRADVDADICRSILDAARAHHARIT